VKNSQISHKLSGQRVSLLCGFRSLLYLKASSHTEQLNGFFSALRRGSLTDSCVFFSAFEPEAGSLVSFQSALCSEESSVCSEESPVSSSVFGCKLLSGSEFEEEEEGQP